MYSQKNIIFLTFIVFNNSDKTDFTDGKSNFYFGSIFHLFV